MPHIYIAGPMRNNPLFNFPEFIRAEGVLHHYGWSVVNPAARDLAAWITSVVAGKDEHPSMEEFVHGKVEGVFDEAAYMEIVQRDMELILKMRPSNGDAIGLLSGWERSKGARAEAALGTWMGLRVMPVEEFYGQVAGGTPERAEGVSSFVGPGDGRREQEATERGEASLVHGRIP